ncbi:MAG: ABC transporter permease [Bacteroidia bacterium]|nr:MAG: ABC transporter permease [Bacteroidia bacterium]
MQLQKIGALLRKEAKLEWRQKFALGGILLYLISTVFVAYLAFDGMIPVQTWNALFWLIMLFAAMNSILKSFMQEHENRHLYYFSLVSAGEFMAAKMIYNAILMLGLGLTGFLVFISFMGNPVVSISLFILNMLLGMIGFAAILSLISAIASRAKNNFTLMAVLGFPLILPLLLLLIRVSSAGLHGASVSEMAADIFIIILLISISIILSMILFPYIWRD